MSLHLSLKLTTNCGPSLRIKWEIYFYKELFPSFIDWVYNISTKYLMNINVLLKILTESNMAMYCLKKYIYIHNLIYIHTHIYTRTYIHRRKQINRHRYTYISFFIIQRVKARAIPCPHQPPSRGDNTVSVAQGGTATPGATKQLLPPDRALRELYISSSSSSCHAASADIPDRLSPFLPIIHRLRQVFRVTSRVLT